MLLLCRLDQYRSDNDPEDGWMSHLTKALNGNPDRTEALRDWFGMYIATLLVTSFVILCAR
ncbi:MAG: hypothetical protein CME04_05890 [Gemmatimonadaceae bacterium]|nr:hypothetical protein [Gemmatimonadaceae bacterium]